MQSAVTPTLVVIGCISTTASGLSEDSVEKPLNLCFDKGKIVWLQTRHTWQYTLGSVHLNFIQLHCPVLFIILGLYLSIYHIASYTIYLH